MALFLALLCVLAITMYLYYKTKFFRTKDQQERVWLTCKSNIALGLFVFFFGINQLVVWDTTITKIIGILFLIVGALSVFQGFRIYRKMNEMSPQQEN